MRLFETLNNLDKLTLNEASNEELEELGSYIAEWLENRFKNQPGHYIYNGKSAGAFATSAIRNFISKHPEYTEEDAHNIFWDAFDTAISSGKIIVTCNDSYYKSINIPNKGFVYDWLDELNIDEKYHDKLLDKLCNRAYPGSIGVDKAKELELPYLQKYVTNLTTKKPSKSKNID